MKTLILKIEYDGTNYSGWQIQPNAPTIQEKIETAAERLFGIKSYVTGAGRTDAGVHARGQVAHITFNKEIFLNKNSIRNALNYYLPRDIRINEVFIVDGAFNARFDASAREYSYTIITRDNAIERHFACIVRYQMNFEKLKNVSKLFIGKHNFTTFSKYNPETTNYVCTVDKCSWHEINDYKIILEIRANRFVYGMVRSLVGAMLDVARGKRSIEDIGQSLIRENRNSASPLAPSQGLVLEKVYYKEEFDFLNKW